MEVAHLDIEAIKRGDAKAFDDLYNSLYRKLCYFVENITKEKATAEDIVADTFNKFYKLRANFNNTNSIRAFFMVTCRNASYDHLRMMKRKNGRIQSLSTIPESNEYPQEENDALYALIEAETIKRIYDEIERLPERRKEVLKLYYIQNLKTESIAKKLEMTVNTVQSTRRQALEQLKNVLAERNLAILIVAILLLSFF